MTIAVDMGRKATKTNKQTNMVAQMNGHTESVYNLCFSRCGSVFASGMYKW